MYVKARVNLHVLIDTFCTLSFYLETSVNDTNHILEPIKKLLEMTVSWRQVNNSATLSMHFSCIIEHARSLRSFGNASDKIHNITVEKS